MDHNTTLRALNQDVVGGAADFGSAPPARPASRLSEQQLVELRHRAAAEAGPFVDPARFRAFEQLPSRFHQQWRDAVLGPWRDERPMSYRSMCLILLAAEAEPDPPPRQPTDSELAYRQAQKRYEQAVADAAGARRSCWAALRAAFPVPVAVVHNYTSARHLATYVQGVDHILVQEPLHAGRIRRDPGSVLCATPSNRHNVSDLGPPKDDRQVPECKRCLQLAHRITGLAVDALIAPRPRWPATRSVAPSPATTEHLARRQLQGR